MRSWKNSEGRQLDPFEKTMASFLNGRGWLVVDGSKYQKDLQILKEYQQCWSHVSPTETLSQVLMKNDFNYFYCFTINCSQPSLLAAIYQIVLLQIDEVTINMVCHDFLKRTQTDFYLTINRRQTVVIYVFINNYSLH